MTVPFFMWALFGWIVSGTIAAIMSLAWEGNVSIVNDFVQFNVMTVSSLSVFGNTIPIPVVNLGWVASLAAVASYDYEFLKGDLNMIRWFVFLVVAGGFSFGLIREFGPLMIQAIGALMQGVSGVLGGVFRRIL